MKEATANGGYTLRTDRRTAFREELGWSKQRFKAGELSEAFHHLERAHILGQLHPWDHMLTHWWMLRIGWRRAELREIVGQIFRMAAVLPGYVFGWVPLGNTGGSDVSPFLPIPLPADLARHFEGYSASKVVLRRLTLGLLVAAVLAGAMFFAHMERERAAVAATIEREWNSERVARLDDWGETRTLEVLPLVNWHAQSTEFRTEAGVSYLVRTDRATILFDLGWNARGESPSPLLYNMELLGISLTEIDAVFVSHAHRDHVGGERWSDSGSFSLGPDQIPLRDTAVFAPTDLNYPGAEVTRISGPTNILPGVASTGPIARSLFIGRVDEQALVINVAGKGLVMIVGCGHQTLAKLLERVDEAFAQPLYGIVGDLHYPFPRGRLHVLGIDLQRRFASGDGPFQPITEEQVMSEIAMLEKRGLGLVSLGGHDTSDEMLEEFARRFGDRFRRAEVGIPIQIRPPLADDKVRS